MLKKESIYLEILENYFERKLSQFTQKEVSIKQGISVGLVNKAVKSLAEIGAVKQRLRSNSLIDAKKLLLYWASQRKLHNDVVYKTHFEGSIKQIESSMPPDVVFTAYSGYRLKYGDAPADYDKVIVYGENAEEFKKRFPPSKKYANVFLLKKPEFLKAGIAPASVLYVDLWNLRDWFASDYLNALEKRLFK